MLRDPWFWLTLSITAAVALALVVALSIGGDVTTTCGVQMGTGQYVCVVQP